MSTTPEQRARKRARDRRYRHSAKGHDRDRRYNQSAKGHARMARYNHSEKGVARNWRKKPFGTLLYHFRNQQGVSVGVWEDET